MILGRLENAGSTHIEGTRFASTVWLLEDFKLKINGVRVYSRRFKRWSSWWQKMTLCLSQIYDCPNISLHFPRLCAGLWISMSKDIFSRLMPLTCINLQNFCVSGASGPQMVPICFAVIHFSPHPQPHHQTKTTTKDTTKATTKHMLILCGTPGGGHSPWWILKMALSNLKNTDENIGNRKSSTSISLKIPQVLFWILGGSGLVVGRHLHGCC